MLCYVMLCYVMLCYVMLCCYVMCEKKKEKLIKKKKNDITEMSNSVLKDLTSVVVLKVERER